VRTDPIVDVPDGGRVLEIAVGHISVIITPVDGDKIRFDGNLLVNPERVGDFQFDFWIEFLQMAEQRLVDLV